LQGRAGRDQLLAGASRQIYLYYYSAVRDKNGVFKGALEMMQDITRIRSLEDKRTLVTWDDLKKNTGSDSL